ncbi:MAG: hypothetical protein WBV73_05105, partial [Phormidium sp.]
SKAFLIRYVKVLHSIPKCLIAIEISAGITELHLSVNNSSQSQSPSLARVRFQDLSAFFN